MSSTRTSPAGAVPVHPKGGVIGAPSAKKLERAASSGRYLVPRGVNPGVAQALPAAVADINGPIVHRAEGTGANPMRRLRAAAIPGVVTVCVLAIGEQEQRDKCLTLSAGQM